MVGKQKSDSRITNRALRPRYGWMYWDEWESQQERQRAEYSTNSSDLLYVHYIIMIIIIIHLFYIALFRYTKTLYRLKQKYKNNTLKILIKETSYTFKAILKRWVFCAWFCVVGWGSLGRRNGGYRTGCGGGSVRKGGAWFSGVGGWAGEQQSSGRIGVYWGVWMACQRRC